ncbi:MAG: hypothetical protein HY700_20815 [Gemmatimonadetes bacterium]|nr:hypothetical protein [Gemmatimonadota bacterium]
MELIRIPTASIGARARLEAIDETAANPAELERAVRGMMAVLEVRAKLQPPAGQADVGRDQPVETRRVNGGDDP